VIRAIRDRSQAGALSGGVSEEVRQPRGPVSGTRRGRRFPIFLAPFHAEEPSAVDAEDRPQKDARDDRGEPQCDRVTRALRFDEPHDAASPREEVHAGLPLVGVRLFRGEQIGVAAWAAVDDSHTRCPSAEETTT